MVRTVEASMRGYGRKIGLDDVSPRSVRRKVKDKAFAKDVNRVDIQKGAVELGVGLDEHIAFVVESMKLVTGPTRS